MISVCVFLFIFVRNSLIFIGKIRRDNKSLNAFFGREVCIFIVKSWTLILLHLISGSSLGGVFVGGFVLG